MQQRANFFLGSKTKKGFYSFFEQLQDEKQIERVYLLKGGPGCGKSTLMRQIGTALEQKGKRLVWIPCASDPESLDSVIDLDARTAIVDATAPHTLDPKLPGAVETVLDVGNFWREEDLRNHRAAIIRLNQAISNCHQRAGALVCSGERLLDWNYKMAKRYVDAAAMQKEAQAILSRLEPEQAPRVYKGLLSAVSVGEVKFLNQTFDAMCDRVYTIIDDWGAASDDLMHKLLDGAIAKGLTVIVCYCSIGAGERIDHLIFPKQRVGVSHINDYHAVNHPDTVLVPNWMNPIEEEEREPMWEMGDLAMELIDQATQEVLQAKHIHDELEDIYKKAMDFTKVSQLQSKVLEQWG